MHNAGAGVRGAHHRFQCFRETQLRVPLDTHVQGNRGNIMPFQGCGTQQKGFCSLALQDKATRCFPGKGQRAVYRGVDDHFALQRIGQGEGFYMDIEGITWELDKV